MSARPDPRWLPAAEWAFNALLHLYPSSLRREHGDEMRQAFRDRCREARAQRSPAQLLFFELLPDTMHGIADAHWHEDSGEARRWQLLALAMLLLASGWLLFQGPLSAQLLDWEFQAKYAIQNARQARAMAIEEAQIEEFAGLLAKEDSAASRAQAAYLYRGLYDARQFFLIYGQSEIDDDGGRWAAYQDVVPAYGVAAGTAATASFSEGREGWVAAAAAQACMSESGCDRSRAISRLLALEPRNAYGWALAFKQASVAHNEQGMRRALAGIAASTSYDDHLGAIRAAIFASASRLLPQDEDARAIIAKRVVESRWIDTAGFTHDARLQCSLRTTTAAPRTALPTWVESHPGSEADCLRIARLFTESASPFTAFRGEALLAQRDAGPRQKAALERAQQFYFASMQVGVQLLGERRWRPWTSAEWNRWAAQWQPGETEASVARRWSAVTLD
jgi:hypothetical protein